MALYGRLLTRWPLPTKMMTSCTLAFSSDVLVQHFSSAAEDRWNWKRSARLGLGSFLFTAPIGHFWLGYVARRTAPPNVDASAVVRSTNVLLKRVVLDQSVASPISPLIFFTGQAMLERIPGLGLPHPQPLAPVLREHYVRFVVMGASMFTPASLIAHSLLPLQYRVPFYACVSFGYGSFVSFFKHRRQP